MVSPGNRHCANCIGTLSFSLWTIDAECDLFRHQQWINISSGIYVEKCQLSFRHYRYNISTIGKAARLFTVWVIWAGIYKAGTLPTLPVTYCKRTVCHWSSPICLQTTAHISKTLICYFLQQLTVWMMFFIVCLGGALWGVFLLGQSPPLPYGSRRLRAWQISERTHTPTSLPRPPNYMALKWTHRDAEKGICYNISTIGKAARLFK